MAWFKIGNRSAPRISWSRCRCGNRQFCADRHSSLSAICELERGQGKVRSDRVTGKNKILSLAEVQAFASGVNVATKGKAKQSSDDFAGTAERAIDGNTSGVYTNNSVTHTKQGDAPWWELELNQPELIERISLWNRTDGTVGDRLAGAQIKLLDESRKEMASYEINTPQAENGFDLIPNKTLKWTGVKSDFSQPGFRCFAGHR